MGQLEKEYVKQALNLKLAQQNELKEARKEEEKASTAKFITSLIATPVLVALGIIGLVALFGLSSTLGWFGMAAALILPWMISSSIKKNKEEERKEKERQLQSENYKKPIQIDSPTSMKEINKEFRRQESEGPSNFIQF